MKHTPLYELCLEEGCRMVPFAGWEMPLTFSGLMQEHHAVRQKVGVFDISHMGILLLEGKKPKDALQKLVPTDLYRIGPGEACYTVLLEENGGIIDDLIIYDLGSKSENSENLLLIINAARYTTDQAWLKKHLMQDCIEISNVKKDSILLALQGPQAIEILQDLTDEPISNLPKFGHKKLTLPGLETEESDKIFIARTGYTGEEGFELLLQKQTGCNLWRKLLDKGVTPCGLGARDTLRLEAAMPLYGNDINKETTPFEAGLGWLVHLEMPTQFIGRNALEKQLEKGISRRLIGLKIQGRAIARPGQKILKKGQEIGKVTSGTWSPTLKEAIALAYVPSELAKIGNTLEIEIRQSVHQATIVKKPFYRSQNLI